MKNLTALSLSIGLLGGLATYLALGPLSGFLFIWTIFIVWGAFFALGGTTETLKNVIVCGIFGVFMAWVTSVAIINIPLAKVIGLPFWGAIAVGISVILIVLAANIPAFATIPASFFGYAPTFAYLLQTPDKLNNKVLFGAVLANPLIIISISIVVGAIFGLSSGKLGAMWTKKE